MTITEVRATVSNTPWSQFSQADYDIAQWRRACIVDMGTGDENTKARYKIPVREPNGTLNRNGVHAAAGAHGLQGVSAPAEVKRAAARKLVGLYRSQLKQEPPSAILTMAGMSSGSNSSEPGEFYRSLPFEMKASDHGDGLTFEGYAAVFNSPTMIADWEGDFQEQIAPGAFKRTLAESPPVLMFEHGRHPLIGTMPLGVITDAREDSHGLFISARLSDNWLIQPVRDAVRDGAVKGMSFRFSVAPGGEQWVTNANGPDMRTLTDLDVAELGPVVFPAYEPTTAMVRSMPDMANIFRAVTNPGAEPPEPPDGPEYPGPFFCLVIPFPWGMGSVPMAPGMNSQNVTVGTSTRSGVGGSEETPKENDTPKGVDYRTLISGRDIVRKGRA